MVAINAIHLDRIPQFDYDRLLWGERQLRSVANMTRADARDFLQVAREIGLRPKVTAFPLDQVNEALIAVKEDSIDGAAVMTSGHRFFVSGHRFSDAVSSSKSEAPLGAGHRKPSFSANSLAAGDDCGENKESFSKL
ncbi:MAG TPA: hypothetical protein VK821_02895 [Dehalococcoidia bacterium]|nr:hypothetical protein [Dehalococcoidia bacterium]